MTKLVAYFRICLYMVDRTKRFVSVGLAQARLILGYNYDILMIISCCQYCSTENFSLISIVMTYQHAT